MNAIRFTPIGIIHTPFKDTKGTPIQAIAGKGIKGHIEIFDEYVEGLNDIDGFSHIILLYHCHLCGAPSLIVTPFLDGKPHGVFATRSPSRPNPIGLSIVRLLTIEGNILHIEDLDMLDGTPLLDIKPYVPEFDQRKTKRIGWLAKNVKKLTEAKNDGRFSK